MKTQPTVWASQPDIAAFDKIENEQLAAAQRAIDQIVAVKGARTIENTLAPYDEAMRQLNAAIYFSTLMQQVHPDAAYRDAATAMTTKVSSAQSALSLNRDVYQALASLDVSKADAATRYYVQRQLLEFRLAGVDKDDATRKKLNQLNDRLTDDQSKFDRNISDDQKTSKSPDASELEGLPQDFIDKQKRGPDGKIQIPADEPNTFPVLTLAKSDALRRRIWEAWNGRAYPKNREVLLDMMQARYEIANTHRLSLLGGLQRRRQDDREGKQHRQVYRRPGYGRAPYRGARVRHAAGGEAQDRSRRNARFWAISIGISRSWCGARNTTSIRSPFVPTLPFNQVKQRHHGYRRVALPRQLSRRNRMCRRGTRRSRPGTSSTTAKSSAASISTCFRGRANTATPQMSPVLDGIRGKQLPEAILVCNFPQPSATDPGLMEYSDVITFFHEFGHLMHHILGGQQQWAGISGISMEADFVEAPSQMLEEWMRSPQVLATFAQDYKTGEPIPADLVARMNRASAFGRGTGSARRTLTPPFPTTIYKGDPTRRRSGCDSHRELHAATPCSSPLPATLTCTRASVIWRATRPPTTPTCGTR